MSTRPSALTRAVVTCSLIALAALALAACGTTTGGTANTSTPSSGGGSGSATTAVSASNPLKVAIMYDSGINDGAWTWNWNQARLAVVQHFGSNVKFSYVENVPQTPQSTQVINNLVQAGNKLIINNSFGYHQYVAAAAKRYPDVKFITYGSSELAPNLSEMQVAVEQPFYVAGMTLAAASKSGKIGVVAPLPVPQLINEINAITLGARAINPRATVKVIFTGSFFDEPKERLAAQGLIASGVDAMGALCASPAVSQAAASANVPWISDDLQNAASYGSTTYLLSARLFFAPGMISAVQSVIGGTWHSQASYGTWSSGSVGVTPSAPAYGAAFSKDVSNGDQAKINQAAQALQHDSLKVYQGPVTDQSGHVRVKAGATLGPVATQTITWFVQGVIGNA